MYDLKTGSDTGREWIEIFNNGSVPVDLSSFIFFEADTNHKLKLVQGDTKVNAQGYALIVSDYAKFKTDWANLFGFSGTIFDSTFSLNNSGENLAIKDGDLIVDQHTYSSSAGGAGDGKSLQKINGVWVSAMPTPGAENKIVFAQPSVQQNKNIITSIPIKNLTQDKKNKVAVTTPITTQNLSANVFSSDTGEKKNNTYFFILILIPIIIFGTGAVYFLRKKRIVSKIGEDFEILED
jgi:hypothetical protein